MSASPTILRFQDPASWLDARRQFVGASEAAAVCGLDPYTSSYALWAEKVGLIGDDAGESDGDISEAAYWGTVLEPLIAKRYAEETGFELRDHGRWTIMRGSHPHLAATLDREILAPAAPGVLEIKAPGFLQRDTWESGPPERHVIQLQAQLAVTGYEWGAIAALIGGQDFRVYRIDRDQELIDLVIERVDEFMRCVRDQVPPEPDGSESTRRVLKKLFPEDSGVEVELEPHFERHARRLKKARALKSRIEDVISDAENHLMAAIETATWAKVGEFRLSAKTTKRGGYTVEPTSYRVLRFETEKKTRKRGKA